MIWLTWRQFRAQAVVVCGLLAAIAIALAVTGPHLVHLYDTTVGPCASHGDCPAATEAFMKNDRLLQQLGQLVLAAPALIGIFWGAPLIARELENNTFRLAWTQSVRRTRWLAIKLGLVGLAAMVATGLLSLMVTWWSSPFDRITDSPFSPSSFDRRDLVPIGYAAFAFVLGVVAGVLIRRTLPAMVATLVAFIGVREAFVEWVRPHLMTPLRALVPLNAQNGVVLGPAGYASGHIAATDWDLSEQTVNRAGRVIGENGGIGSNGSLGFNVAPNGTLTMQGVGTCPNKAPVGTGPRLGAPSPAFQRATQECVDKLGIREVLRYQPISRYWAFQWYETAIFIGFALVLAGLCFWWVRHRLS
jgi:hypothetical protein